MHYTHVKQARPGISPPRQACCYFTIVPMYLTLTSCLFDAWVSGTMILLLQGITGGGFSRYAGNAALTLRELLMCQLKLEEFGSKFMAHQ